MEPPVGVSTNPFEVEASSDLPSPIPFAGKLTLQDARVALWDAGPRKIGDEFGLLAALSFSFYFFWMVEESWADDRPMSSLIWMGSAFFLLIYWLRFNRYLTPGYWKRLARIKMAAAQAKFLRGWIDSSGVILADGHEFARLQWKHFVPVFAFAKHLSLPARFDANLRIVIPIRFFPTIHAAEQAIGYLREKIGFGVDETKKTQKQRVAEFETQPDRGEPDQEIWPMLSAIDYEEANSWDTKHWPFAPQEKEELTCRLVPTSEAVTSFRSYLIGVGTAILYGMWFILPGILAALGWFLTNFWHEGDLSFLTERMPSTLMATVPIGLALSFFAWAGVKHLLGVGELLADDRWLCIRPSGVHYAESVVSLWWTYKALAEIKVEENRIVLTLAEGHAELPIPKDFFESEETFAQASQRLSKYHRTSLQSTKRTTTSANEEPA